MNHKRILSNSALKSPSSGKIAQRSDEVSSLQEEVEALKQTVGFLKVSLENRDAAIGTLAREKEKLYVELKSAQRTNRNLHQQLEDERGIHAKEKEFLSEEITRLSQRHCECHVKKKYQKDNGYNELLEEELKAKDEIIYNMGAKYLKIKLNKHILMKKLEKLESHNQKTCENIILLLEENRRHLDDLLNNLIKSMKTSPSSRKYLELLHINTSLHFENTQMKLCFSNERLLRDLLNEQQQSDDEKAQKSDDKETCITTKITTQAAVHNCKVNQYHKNDSKKPKSTLCDAILSPTLKRSKSTILNRNISCRHFRCVHEQLSPYLGCRIRCTKSDSYLIRP